MKNKYAVSFLLFITTFIVYYLIFQEPRTWYDHYLHLAKSFMVGRIDVPSLPEFYHDRVVIAGKVFLPFPPLPAVVLVPLVSLYSKITQQQASILVGSLDVALIYLLLLKYVKPNKSLLLTIFFAFGTVHFWASVVGTTWYFAHVVATFFIILAVISHLKKRDFLAGVLLSLAILARLPMFMAIIFFILQLIKDGSRLRRFLAGALLVIPVMLYYNWARFDNVFTSGYVEVYKSYVNANYPYTILQAIKPGFPYFGYLDPRNIPLHLLTFLAIPPVIKDSLLRPLPYGMGIVFTSPLLILALIPRFKSKLEKSLIIGVLFITLVDFMHYMQGWVQFGYRYALDFMVFLIILLAIRFTDKRYRLYLILVIISITVTTWGVLQAIKLGW